jgi:glucose/mannose-6-phosphate isomerase
MIDRSADKQNMYQIIKDFPQQFAKGIKYAQGVKAQLSTNRVVIAGMGGSAFPGDIVKLCLGENSIPITIWRDYQLPATTDSETLVFCSSFSGDTEETIACFYEGLQRGAQLVTVTSGGRLEELSLQYGVPMVRIVKEVPHQQPRTGTGYFVSAYLTVMANSRLIADKSEELIALGRYLASLDLEPQAMEMADTLVDHIPIIYSAPRYGEALSRVIKIKFNENSKTQAFYNVFPELTHNEMVGFTHIRARYHFIVLRDPADHPRVQRRMEIFGDLFKARGIPVTYVVLKEGSLLERIFSTLYLFDWVSYYLALRYGIDPTPVQTVTDFKEAMGAYTVQ